MNLKVASILATLVLIGCAATLLAMRAILANRLALQIVQGLAVALMIWARATFGLRSFHPGANPTAGGLVTRGPYRFLRHPIYAAILYFLWAGIVTHASPLSVAVGLVAAAAIAVRIGAEERLIVEQYPEYVEYAARTRRILPFVF